VGNKESREEALLLLWFLYSFGLLACCARTLAQKNKETREESTIINRSDDSGSKLRDKEQQRLSSK